MSSLPVGVFPPLITPFKKDQFARQHYIDNIERLNETDLAGYVVLGSNGEGVYLSDDEASSVIETAMEHRAEGKSILVGTGRESTRRTIEFTRRASELGADAALVVPPSYYRAAMTESALEFHYRSVADEAKVPIVLYYVPKFAPVTFTPRLVANLASHPNIVGIKDTSGDMVFLASILKDRPDDFKVYIGSASIFLAGMALGVDGGILALANIAAEDCVALYHHAKRGDMESARNLQYRLLPVNQAVTARFGIAGLKQAMDLLGFKGGDPRRPLEPLSQKQVDELSAILESGGLLIKTNK